MVQASLFYSLSSMTRVGSLIMSPYYLTLLFLTFWPCFIWQYYIINICRRFRSLSSNNQSVFTCKKMFSFHYYFYLKYLVMHFF